MTAWVWLDERDSLAVLDRSLVLHGGEAGVRDHGLLASALARPRQLAADGQAVDLADLAAAYSSGLVRNHPFIDGNKRTAFVIGILFLELNGARFTAAEAAATQAVLDLADRTIDDAAYAAFLRETCRDD